MKHPDDKHHAMRDIENALDQCPFKGYRIGPSVSDYLVHYVLNENYSSYMFLRYLAKAWIAGFKPHTKRNYPDNWAGKVIFTWINQRPELAELVLPLVDVFGRGALVVGSSGEMKAALPADVSFIAADEIMSFHWIEWFRRFLWTGTKAKFLLLRCVVKGKLPLKAFPLMMYGLIVQTQRLLAAEQFIAQVRPKAIVTEYDRSIDTSCLMLAADRAAVPTITMVHGAINPYPAYGMFPIIADYVMCWGELQKAQFIVCGVPPEKLQITGCHRLSRKLKADRNEVRQRLGIEAGATVVTLATNPIRPDLKLQLARKFCEGVFVGKGVVGMIRLHPGEVPAEYASVTQDFPGLKVVPNKTLSVDESLAVSDIVACHNTGYGSDALIKGVPVVVLDVIDQPLLNAQELIDKAGCVRAVSSEKLRAAIQGFVTGGADRMSLSESAESYVQALCSAFDKEALANAVRLIKDVDHA